MFVSLLVFEVALVSELGAATDVSWVVSVGWVDWLLLNSLLLLDGSNQLNPLFVKTVSIVLAYFAAPSLFG